MLGYDEDAAGANPKDDLGVIKEEEDDEDDARNKSPAKKRGAKQLQLQSNSNLVKSQEAGLIKKRQIEEEAIQKRLEEEQAAA